ncbi:recombinase family protein [Desulfosporosinus acididurans]|uniref:recombinase family protein n=1 Tax=Desulfosporosinus acididurans TaxID=476652 RepID=UPI0013791EE8|nr:recombinase family protein [Desulfosporosinus acididurans]
MRISRDEDGSKESISSQKDVIKDFADELGIELIDIIEDNDISGYSYSRPGINRIIKLIDDGVLDVLVAKDLSRIGRHNAKTLLFIEELEDKGVSLRLKSGNMDENMRGIQTWYNELYVRDISRKTKDALRTKQKNGEIHSPHFGYRKDPANKGKCIIDEEAADTVRLIFNLYLHGYGVNKIAKHLNEQKIPTPCSRKNALYGYHGKPEWQYKHIWHAESVKRILKNDVYIGVVRRGVTKRPKIRSNKLIKIAEDEQFVLEGAIPAIINKVVFEAVNATFTKRVINGVKAKSGAIYKYTGVVKCGKCGKNLVTVSQVRSYGRKKCYICSTYQRYGKAYCTGHSISHDGLDRIVMEQVESLYQSGLVKMDNLCKSIDQRQELNKDANKQIDKLQMAHQAKKTEIKNYSKQLAQGLINEELFREMTQESTKELERLEQQLSETKNLKEVRDHEKAKLAKALDVLRDTINRKELTHTDIVTLIDKIIVHERKHGRKSKLDIAVEWNIPFLVINEESVG